MAKNAVTAEFKVGDDVDLHAKIVWATAALLKSASGNLQQPSSDESEHKALILEATEIATVAVVEGDSLGIRFRRRMGMTDPSLTWWVNKTDVKKIPTYRQALLDQARGIHVLRRREIYMALHKATIEAEAATEKQFDSETDGTPAEVQAARKKLFDTIKERNDSVVRTEFMIDKETEKLIENEGVTKRWPVTDR